MRNVATKWAGPASARGWRCVRRTEMFAKIDARRKAFTLTELLVILALVALAALMMLPAFAGSRTRSQSVRCLGNLKQMIGAVLMYTHDYHDFFPPNPADATMAPGYNWCEGNVSDGFPGVPEGAQTFDPDILADPRYCLVTSYINTNVTLFRCTADPRTGPYQGTNASLQGQIVPAARTISMNQGVGTIDATYASGGGHSGPPILPVNGPWLTGNYDNRHNNPWRTYGKTSDVVVPSPARLFVIAEEGPWSINDASLAVIAGYPSFVDFPSSLHDMSCVITFADGHVELHKWATTDFFLTGPTPRENVVLSDPDWNWVAHHATAGAL